jgi:hypothetical protein
MEDYRPHFAADMLPDSVERLPFDIVRTLVATRQAATPTAHLLAGRAGAAAPAQRESVNSLLGLLISARFVADIGTPSDARFAICSVGRVVCTDREVSA